MLRRFVPRRRKIGTRRRGDAEITRLHYAERCSRRRASAREVCFIIALVLVGASAAQAATPAQFYKGRTIPVIIGYSAGGGYDLYARVLAEHMGRHIPGNPTLIPQNMPGAGSIRAALYLFTAAPKDGSVIGTFARGMVSTALIGDAKFDARQFTWLGSI